MKFYGNFMNRLAENRNYTDDKLIHEGDDVTMYLWSDRHCYYVTKVIDQKHIFVKEYFVVADHDSTPMSNTWKYFKDPKEVDAYLLKYFPDQDFCHKEMAEEEWAFRNNSWKSVSHLSKQGILDFLAENTHYSELSKEEQLEMYNRHLGHYELNEAKLNKIENGGSIPRYHALSGKVSFGTRDYYYDYEF